MIFFLELKEFLLSYGNVFDGLTVGVTNRISEDFPHCALVQRNAKIVNGMILTKICSIHS